MRGTRFWLIGVVSFITVTLGTFFVSGSFLNRALTTMFCAIFSFSSTFCTPNLGIESDPVMATNNPTFERSRDVYSDVQMQETLEAKKQRNLLAFESLGKEGHGNITEEAIDSIKPLTDKDGTLISFTGEAKKEISLANRGVDIKPDYLDSSFFQANTIYDLLDKDKDTHVYFSGTFYKPSYHFDRETFTQASRWLKFRKDDIIKELDPISDANNEDAITRGKQARKFLGQALHTLQDFYAHTNWVELGFVGEIDKRLGREEIPNPPDWNTSEPVSSEEIKFAEDFISSVNNGNYIIQKLSSAPIGYTKLLGIIVAGSNLILKGHTGLDLATALSTKPGILKPEFKNRKDKKFLTSGYFMGLDPISECSVPNGKTRHGGSSFLNIELGNDKYGLCPNGLNKDDSSRGEGYKQASKLAELASEDYIKQIIEESKISNNIEAIKALMGKNDPCKSKDNQNRDECKLKEGKSTGDPHLATFDGLKYDLQTIGEVILIKSNDGSFEVQARQAPFSSSFSIDSAVAVKVGSDRVALYAREFPDSDTINPLRVNGKSTTIQGGKLSLSGGGEIARQGDTYVISSPTGEKVVVSQSNAGNNAFFNISPYVYNRAGKYSGLLGNVNGNPKDDLQIRGGNNVLEFRSTYGDVNQVLNLVGLRVPGVVDTAEKLYFDQLYKDFANSWRIKQEESLFDYPAGKTTKNYTDPSFPDKYLTLNMLSPDQIQKARNACNEAKVAQDLIEGCIFDVGFSGYSDFARATAEISGYVNIVNQLFPSLNIPTPDQAINRVIQQVIPTVPKVCLPFIGCR